MKLIKVSLKIEEAEALIEAIPPGRPQTHVRKGIEKIKTALQAIKWQDTMGNHAIRRAPEAINMVQGMGAMAAQPAPLPPAPSFLKGGL